MPDIRSFFGGNAPPKESKSPKKEVSKRSRGRKVLDDSDDEAKPSSKNATPKKATPKKRAPTPEGETTTTSDYFGSKKGKKSKSGGAVPEVTITHKKSPAKPSPAKSTPTGRSSTRSRKVTSYKDDDESDVVKLDDDEDEKDDVFTAAYRNGAGKDDYVPEDDMKDVEMVDADEDDASAKGATPTKGKKAATKGNLKRKSAAVDDGGDDEAPKKKRATPKKKDEAQESTAMKAIWDSIPTVRAPTPPLREEDSEGKKKWNPAAFKSNTGPPPAGGSKDIPSGAEGCLAGLSFVFTGLLQSISRDEGQELVKRYSGRVVGAPSKKTDFVVLGSDAGPNKLSRIKEFGIKTINEDGLFELIRRLPPGGGDGKAAIVFQEKKAKEEEKIRKEAEEAEKADERERKRRAVEAKNQNSASDTPAPQRTGGARANDKAPAAGPDMRLWTVKYAPTQMSQICGNKTQVERLQKWLKAWPKNLRTQFKMPGPDGTGIHRAIMIHGPPGIGKTTAAHLVAKLEGYDVVETNASDTRSKKLMEASLKGVLDTTSLLGYFAGDGAKADVAKRKMVLIMDEVDGMSAGDRGGVGALSAVCKKSRIPIILICNERRLPKMKPFDHVTYDMPFRRPTNEMIRSRLMTIAFREKLKVPNNVLDALIEGSRADIRQVVNMLSTAKLDQEVEGASALDFDSSKQMSKAWEKHVVLKPWDMVSKILGGGLFSASSKTTLNQKAELYFNDHEFAPLMLQENYLGSTPPQVTQLSGPDRNLKHLELIEKAAESISDGDLVDRVIHGSEQHWALMPTHAIFSFVRPASFVAGTMAGTQTAFTQWLGKNSSYGKLTRQVKEIQGHMRLRTSGDRHEIRQQYMPLLWDKLVKRLQKEGKEAVPEIIDLMDSYFLTKEDFDSIMELGVGPMDASALKIETQAKATFTRLYNSQSHPMPFMKASSVLEPKKAAKVKPDLEEALEESDEGEVVEEGEEGKPDVEEDISKDKYVKPAKKPAKGKASKKTAATADEDDEGEKPKKGKATAKGKGRAKK